MAKSNATKKKVSKKAQTIDPDSPELKQFVRIKAEEYLKDPNINSIGIGYKMKNGKSTNEISIQFTVDEKLSKSDLVNRAQALGTEQIPETLDFKGIKIKTDVIKRKYEPSYKNIPQIVADERKKFMDPLKPGISIGNVRISAGTFGCIVYDSSGEPYILSNWHVLNGDGGIIGDDIVQPGIFDDNGNSNLNTIGKLKRSFLGLAGDCAIATIEKRAFDLKIYGINVFPDTIVNPQLGDKLVKSGRTTGVTHGSVRRIEVIAKINYNGITGIQLIGGFEIGYDDENMPGDGEISKGGDSGAVWLIYENNKPSTKIVGLHFAGNALAGQDEHALACNIDSVFKKLDVSLKKILRVDGVGAGVQTNKLRSGYQENFLPNNIPMPLITSQSNGKILDAASSDNPLKYTHFSIVMNEDRRLCYYTAVNIDGNQLRNVPRGDNWRYDSRIVERFQAGNDLYSGNNLDRGHMVRRLDAVWGSLEEARLANEDTFYYTNSCPQHAQLNQREWNDLEEYILGNADVHNLMVTVFTGPIFDETDIEYRGIKIPVDFWKVVAFVRNDNHQLSVTGYQLTQQNLMDDLEEVFAFGAFRTYQVPVKKIEELSNIDFGDLHNYDPLNNVPESVGIKPLESLRQIVF